MSILIITALGVGMLTGLYAACQDMYYAADQFFDKQNLFDIRILSTLGLTQEDVDALAHVDGVEAVEGGYSETVHTDVDSARKSAEMTILSRGGLNMPQLLAGALPTKEGEISVTQKYLDDSSKSIGDTVTIEEDIEEENGRNTKEKLDMEVGPDGGGGSNTDVDVDVEPEEATEAPTFTNTTYTITGVVLDPKDIRGSDDTGSVFRSTVTADYTFFITEADANSDIFTVVYLTLAGTKEMNSYSDEYENKVQSVISTIESRIKTQREQMRYDAILNEARTKITDAENIMNEKFAEADQKFTDGWRDLDEARQELAAGEATLIDAQKDAEKKIAEARGKLGDAKQTLVEAGEQLAAGEMPLKQGEAGLLAGEKKLAEGEKELRESEQKLADGEKRLLAGEKQLADAEKQLAQGETGLNENAQKLEAGKQQLAEERETTLKQLTVAGQQLDAAQNRLDVGRAQLEPEVAQLKSAFGDAWPTNQWIALVNAVAALAATGADDNAIAAGIASESAALATAIQGRVETMKTTLMQRINRTQAALDSLHQAINALNQRLETTVKQVAAAQTVLAEKLAADAAAQTKLDTETEKLNSLAEGTPEYEAQQAVVADARGTLDATNAAVAAARDALNDAKEAAANLTAERDVQTSAAAEFAAAIKQMNVQAAQLDALSASAVIQAALGTGKVNGGQQVLDRQKNIFAEQKEAALQKLAQAEGALAARETQLEEAQKTIESKKAALEAGKAQLAERRSALEAGKTELAKGWTQWGAGQVELAGGWTEWEDARTKLIGGWAELEAGKIEVAGGEAKLKKEEADAKAKIGDAWDEIAAGKQELADGEVELTKKEQEYTGKKEEARQKIADAYTGLDDIDMTKWYVQDRTSLDSYSSLNSDLSSIEGIGKLFPVIFLLVAVLMSLTTMTRMVEEERGLIGTYKALGFGNAGIYQKYILFAFTACVLGGVLGDVFGFVFMPRFVAVILKSLYSLPRYYLRFDTLYGVGGVALFMVAIIGATALACRSGLKQMPAALLRPKAPRSGARVWLEHIPAIWHRLKFLNKVTVRNLFRYKKRLFMTIGGIMGCTALILCGFAIKDSVLELAPNQYDHIYQYDLMAVFEEKDNDGMIRQLANDSNIDDYLNLRIESIKLLNTDGESSSVQLMVIPNGSTIEDYIRMENLDGTQARLDDDGVLITQNATRILGLRTGGAVSLQNLELAQDGATVAGIVRNYLGNNVFMTQKLYESLFGAYEPNGVLAHLSTACTDQPAYAETLLDNDSVLSAVSTTALRGNFGFDLINAVVLLLIVMAGGLALVVLFTLSNTNISERVRELATIKVLGFYDKEVYQYVNKETLLLTAVGILIGLPVGRIISGFLTTALNMPSIHFAVHIEPVSYLLSAAITFCFAIIVNWITNRTLDRINMVEALKSVE